jgi:hypothetical protein
MKQRTASIPPRRQTTAAYLPSTKYKRQRYTNFLNGLTEASAENHARN